VHGVLFLDSGQAFEVGDQRGYQRPAFRWDRTRMGAGAELRLETALAYWILTDIRIGVARGLGMPLAGVGPSQDPLACWQGYLTIGPSF